MEGVKKVPTVIHIPLFNVDNCGNELEAYREKYRTFQGAYSQEMVEDLIKKAEENVINNKEPLLREIEDIVKQKSDRLLREKAPMLLLFALIT
ncbi:unnamed protein product [Arctogadus glacialis]